MKEPNLSDFIYEEIRECEEYALLNMITFEAAIRNNRVKEILSVLDSASPEMLIDSMTMNTYDVYADLKRELKEEYFLDYYTYLTYIKLKESLYTDESNHNKPPIKEQIKLHKMKSKYPIHISHNAHDSHTHAFSLPLYRPKMDIPQKESNIKITVPMYHIHPKDIKKYYERLLDKHLEIVKDAKDYYKIEELFYDTINEAKSKSITYAEMFFVWDYMEWWKSKNGIFTPDTTARSLYMDIAQIIESQTNDKTGRSSKIEKYLEQMQKLIKNCGYKKYYIPKLTE